MSGATVASSHVMPAAAATVATASTRAEPMPRPCSASTTSKAISAVSGAVRTKRQRPTGTPSTSATQATWRWPSTSASARRADPGSRGIGTRKRWCRDWLDRPSNTPSRTETSPPPSGRSKADPPSRSRTRSVDVDEVGRAWLDVVLRCVIGSPSWRARAPVDIRRSGRRTTVRSSRSRELARVHVEDGVHLELLVGVGMCGPRLSQTAFRRPSCDRTPAGEGIGKGRGRSGRQPRCHRPQRPRTGHRGPGPGPPPGPRRPPRRPPRHRRGQHRTLRARTSLDTVGHADAAYCQAAREPRTGSVERIGLGGAAVGQPPSPSGRRRTRTHAARSSRRGHRHGAGGGRLPSAPPVAAAAGSRTTTAPSASAAALTPAEGGRTLVGQRFQHSPGHRARSTGRVTTPAPWWPDAPGPQVGARHRQPSLRHGWQASAGMTSPGRIDPTIGVDPAGRPGVESPARGWEVPMHVDINLLGGFSVVVDGRPSPRRHGLGAARPRW